MALVSIVIPVYKVGKYIENSMKSVCNQTFKDFEVVLVDNNSPDDSISIAEDVLSKGGVNYKVVKQTVQGLPAARNKGIEESFGEWIVSIDPDDTISSRFVLDLYQCAVSHNLDVVFSKYNDVEEDSLFIFPEETKEDVIELYDKEEIIKLFLTRKLPLMVSNMFFKKESFIAHSYKFDENVVLGADVILLWKILLNTEKVAFINKKLYNHIYRPDSLITAPSEIKIKSNLDGYERLRDDISKCHSLELANWIYGRAVFGILNNLCLYGSKEEYNNYINEYYTKSVKKILNNFPDGKIRFLNKIVNISPGLFYIINKTLRNPNTTLNSIVNRIVYR